MKTVKIALAFIVIAAVYMSCGWLFNHSGFPFIAIIAVILITALVLSKNSLKFFKKLFKTKTKSK